ncbi:hypothetical protein [Yoonia sp. SS1-5]|uniref:Uncharacterized protein n=1 Tax=Yoonia rhodophyticola TaxID=3137370 RepID=A0AAN0M7X1_9RHOB
MTKSIKELIGLNQDEECIKATSMALDQFVRSISRGVWIGAAYRKAIHLHCRQFFDGQGVEDVVERHQACNTLRGELALTFLFTIWADSDDFARAYKEELGRKAPILRLPGQEPKSTFYSKLIREFWVDTKKEEQFGNPDLAHGQRIKRIALAAYEVDLIEYDFESPIKVLYSAKPALHDFFTALMPAQMDGQ